MKLKFMPCFLLLLAAASVVVADVLPQPGSAGTNTVPNPATKAPTGPPKSLEATFTNSVGMILLKVSPDLWAGKYDVTQKEYQKIMGDNPSAFPGVNNPVDTVSWTDAMNFCKKMTDADVKEMLIPEGYYYTLPTEDEWETLVADATLDDAVTSSGSDRTGTSPVGSMKANSLGLCDTRGNVMQLTLGDDSKPYRVLRGGSWQDSIEINLRTAFRFYATPDAAQNTFGFRCVLKKH